MNAKMYAGMMLQFRKNSRLRTKKKRENTIICRLRHKNFAYANQLPKFVTTMALDFLFCELMIRTMAWPRCILINNRSYIYAKRLVKVTWVCAKLHANARHSSIRLQPTKTWERWFGLEQLEKRQFDTELALWPPKTWWSPSLIWK